jgi:hypothetical protein
VTKYKTGKAEVRNFLDVADRDIVDSQKDLSPDWRLNIAYNAALTLATIALAASGYRVAREAHDYRTFQSLEYTIGLDRSTVDQLDAFRKKRNTTGYDMAGTVSEQEANEMVDLAKNLRSMVNGWLRAEHSELL